MPELGSPITWSYIGARQREDGWVSERRAMYLESLRGESRFSDRAHELTDRRISPVYGHFDGFPPTLLVTGTRDLFLSNTARVHIKPRQAGTEADLLVFEGVAHGDYALEATSPQHQLTYAELNRFLLQHLTTR